MMRASVLVVLLLTVVISTATTIDSTLKSQQWEKDGRLREMILSFNKKIFARSNNSQTPVGSPFYSKIIENAVDSMIKSLPNIMYAPFVPTIL